MKKIYFAGSIRGGRDDKDLYAEIIEKLNELGYPEKGNNSIVKKAKSYMNCVVGRINE